MMHLWEDESFIDDNTLAVSPILSNEGMSIAMK